MTAVNRNELCVVGLQRCGQHAVIHWILAQARGRRCFLNDAALHTNPFVTFSPGEIETRGYWRFDLAGEAAGRLSRKDWLIYNYEDAHPLEPFGGAFPRQRDAFVGTSERRLVMLILRDPFNFFASRLQWGRSDSAGWSRRPLRDAESRDYLVALWKAHAREYLGDTRHLPDEAVPVSYNRWCADRDYRRALAGRLGVPFTDKARSRLANYGPASSFDGLRYLGRAHRMDVLERWRHFVGDPFYRAIFEDPEIWSLSDRAFGPLPGASVLREALSA